MSRTIRSLLLSVFSLAVILGGYYLIRSMGGGYRVLLMIWYPISDIHLSISRHFSQTLKPTTCATEYFSGIETNM